MSTKKPWNWIVFENKVPNQPVVSSYKPSKEISAVKRISSAQMDEKRKKGYVIIVMTSGVQTMYVKNQRVYVLQFEQSREVEELPHDKHNLTNNAVIDQGTMKKLLKLPFMHY